MAVPPCRFFALQTSPGGIAHEVRATLRTGPFILESHLRLAIRAGCEAGKQVADVRPFSTCTLHPPLVAGILRTIEQLLVDDRRKVVLDGIPVRHSPAVHQTMRLEF